MSLACLYHRAFAGTYFPSCWEQQTELSWVAGYILRWFACPKTVIHPNTNWARYRVTSLMRPMPLLLCQTSVVLVRCYIWFTAKWVFLSRLWSDFDQTRIYVICRMTNYELLRWLVETRSRDVGHNRTLHSWASDRSTFFHSVAMLHM